MDCGRKLGSYMRRRRKLLSEHKKRDYIEKYIPHIGIALQEILALSDGQRDHTVDQLTQVLQRSRKL
jgi:DNA topoisomerase-6 subunit B